MKQKINLQEIFQEEFDLNHNRIDGKITFKQIAYNAMRTACNKVLDLASENAAVDVVDHEECHPSSLSGYCKGDGSVILPIYGVDDDTILQIKDWIK